MNVACVDCGSENRIPTARIGDGPKCGRCKSRLHVRAPIAVASAADFDEIVANAKVPVVVDFWAAWCGPCRAVAPAIEELASTHEGTVVVVKVDTEALPDVAGRYGIRSIPTFVRFDRGRETSRASGAMPRAALERSLQL